MRAATTAAFLGLATLALAFPATPATAGAGTIQLKVERSGPYGPHLTDGVGRPLYLFTADRPGEDGKGTQTACETDCLVKWPPLVTAGEPHAGEGVDASRMGTFLRPRAITQITYGGWPLYYYAEDEGGEPKGQDVHGFGGEWYLVAPDGSRVQAER